MSALVEILTEASLLSQAKPGAGKQILVPALKPKLSRAGFGFASSEVEGLGGRHRVWCEKQLGVAVPTPCFGAGSQKSPRFLQGEPPSAPS